MINIRKFDPKLLNQPGVVYCGRNRTKRLLSIGLGNPFSHRKNSNAPYQTRTLEESISSYKRWLYKLIKAHFNQQTEYLEDWERRYLKRVLKLSQNLKAGQVTDLMCFCVEKFNYRYRKADKIQCHTQILYGFCLAINRYNRRITEVRVKEVE